MLSLDMKEGMCVSGQSESTVADLGEGGSGGCNPQKLRAIHTKCTTFTVLRYANA